MHNSCKANGDTQYMKIQIVPPRFVLRSACAAFAGILILCSAGATRAATVLLSENWESYSVGASPVAPWQNRFGGGTTPAASVNTIVSQTINSTTSNWVLIGNNATDEPVSNPGLVRPFTAQTLSTPLEISFSFMIPANYGSSSQQLFTLGYTAANGTLTTGISLYLGPNYQGGSSSLGYKTSTGSRVSLANATFTAGAAVTVNLTNISQSAGTYDLAWSDTTGKSGSLGGIAVTNNSTANVWNSIAFGDNSAVTSTSLIYLDNIVVAAVPEPAAITLGLIGGLSVLGLYRRRQGRTSGK